MSFISKRQNINITIFLHYFIFLNCNETGAEEILPGNVPVSSINPAAFKFIKSTSLQYMVTNPQKWSPICQYLSSHDDYFYNFVVSPQLTDIIADTNFMETFNRTFWLPSKCEPEYSLFSNLTQSTFQNPIWKKTLNRDWIEYSDLNGGCIKLCGTIKVNYFNSTFSFEEMRTLCNEKYPILCVYSDTITNNLLTQSSCPNEYFMSKYYGFQDKCYSLKKINLFKLNKIETEKVEFAKESDDMNKIYFTNLIGTELKIDLTRKDGLYQTNRTQQLELEKGKEYYVLVTKETPVQKSPSLTIKYNSIEDVFNVEITNDQSLMEINERYKFQLDTSAQLFNKISMHYRLTSSTFTTRISHFTVSLDEFEIGIFTYSVFGHIVGKVGKSQLIQSNLEHVRHNSENMMIFICEVDINISSKRNTTSPLSDYRTTLDQLFEANSLQLEDLQFKKIFEPYQELDSKVYNQSIQRLPVVLHFLIINEESIPFLELKSKIELTLNTSEDLHIVKKLTSADYCFTNDNTFPAVQFGEISTNTDRVCDVFPKRICNQFDPIYGVSWDSSDISCKEVTTHVANVTKTLITIIEKDEPRLDKLDHVSEFVAKINLTASDVAVLGNYMKNCNEEIVMKKM